MITKKKQAFLAVMIETGGKGKPFEEKVFIFSAG